MKTTLIALAALGALAGTAAAQSSVTIYGIVDAAISKSNNGTSNLSYFNDWHVGPRNAWTMHPAQGSRLGFRGTEDLGSGLRANFLLEHRFLTDNGGVDPRDGIATASPRTYNAGFWNAQSYVGLSSTSLGEVRLGRQVIPHFWVVSKTDPFGYEINVASLAGMSRAGNGATMSNNAVSYFMPKLGGVTAQLLVGLGEGGAAAVGAPVPGRNVGFNVEYTGGPLWLGLGYNDAKQEGTPAVNRVMTLGAISDFGMIKPMFNYTTARNNVTAPVLNASSKVITLGAHIPAGNGFVRTGVGRITPAVGNNLNASPASPYNAAAIGVAAPTNGQATTKVSLGYVYPLSKRTSVAADITTAKTSGNLGGTTSGSYSRSNGFQAGLRHSF